MSRPRSTQELIHWLEMGEGARWIRVGALLLGILVLSLVIAWKQFHGATTESALLQADVGRQLSRGEGFTTLVAYPQTAAFLHERGVAFAPAQPFPELYQAPLYSLVIAGALRLLPGSFRDSLFTSVPVPPDGFHGDYLLLGINVVLLWATAWLTYSLTRRLFDSRVAGLAVGALLLSVGVWQQVVVVNGAPLLMLLSVAAFWIWARIDEQVEETGRAAFGGMVALGVTCGLLFLTEYSAGALIVVALGYAAIRFGGAQRWKGGALMIAGFLLVATPWVVRNFAVSGLPTALAVQNIALKAGDPTAEPTMQRRAFSAELPSIDLPKLANKTLTALQDNVKHRLWSGGAMWFVAFFVAGWLYPFRSPVANRLRWIYTAALAVMMLAQAMFNSGESERLVASWLAPGIIIFGAGFFSVLLSSNALLNQWPKWSMAGLLMVQALPLLQDALEPRTLHFQFPPYFPKLFADLRQNLEQRDTVGRFGVMADVPAGVAWYGDSRVWAQPAELREFYAINLEQPIGQLVLTPATLDRPFFSELAARPVEPHSLGLTEDVFGDWGRIYSGLLTGRMPSEFPFNAPHRLVGNFYVLLNSALPPGPGK